MKFLLITFGLYLTLLFFGYAADSPKEIDSLEHLLQQRAYPDTVRVNTLNQLGYLYWISDPRQSVTYGEQALVLADSLAYLPGTAYAQRVLGVANWAQGNYEEGLRYLMEALVQYQSLNDSVGIANVLLNTGQIYSDQNSYDEALTYYEEAYRTFKSLAKQDRQIHTAIHIGQLHHSVSRYDLAQTYYQQALQLSDSAQNNYGLATSYLNLGRLALAMGNLDQATSFCQQALPIQQAINDGHGKSLTYYTLGSIERAKGNYVEAEEHLLHALKKATKVSSRQNRRDIYLELKQVAEATDNYEQALTYFGNYHALQDSLLNAEKLREIVRLENRYELDKKERELLMQQQSVNLMQQEARIQSFFRNGLMIGIIALAFIGYLITSRQRLKIKKNREVFHSRQQLDQAELENAQLKQKKLTQELEYKSKELTSYTINFIQKNELMDQLKLGIQQAKRQAKPEVRQQLNSLSRLVDQNLHIDREWADFKRHFEEVHKDFFTQLKNYCSELSTSELKLCALLKLNMSMKEMANILGISPDSVKTARYRLRKKLGLEREEKLADFIINVEQNSEATSASNADLHL